jgi:Family of unknown function (DUF6527)
MVRHVKQMPAVLEPGFLYVSAEYGTAAHLCACGCASKIRTPLGPTEWMLEEDSSGPTLEPSIGNWQRPCRSHYWIVEGRVRWAESWSAEQVEAGRRYEDARRNEYYDSVRGGFFAAIWRRLVEWFRPLG